MNKPRGFKRVTTDWEYEVFDLVEAARGVTPENPRGDTSRWQWLLDAIRVKLAAESEAKQ